MCEALAPRTDLTVHHAETVPSNVPISHTGTWSILRARICDAVYVIRFGHDISGIQYPILKKW